MKKITIRNALFSSYFLIILVSFLSVVTIYGFFEAPKMTKQMLSALEQNCSSIAQSVDTEMEQIRVTAMSMAYSFLNKDTSLSYQKLIKPSLTTQDTSELQLLLSAMVVPNDNMDQVYLYLPSENIIGTGPVNSICAGSAEEQKWYDQVMRGSYHNAFVYMGKDDVMGKYSTGLYSKYFVAYVMELTDKYMSNGYIEIRRDVETVFSSAIGYNSVCGEKIYVMDGYGDLIYPVDASMPECLMDYSAKEKSTIKGYCRYKDHFVFCSPSECSDFCTVLVIRTQDLMRSVFDYLKVIVLIAILMMIFAVAISYYLSKRMSLPVQEMCDEVAAFDLTNSLQTKELQTNVAELSTLHEAFLDMREKLADSMNKQLLLQSQEMQSRMLALQAQMNPHFLHNSLATIQAMADANMNDEIVEMCVSTSEILRYISSDNEQEVSLQEEIRHVSSYLRCMDIRYQGDLTCTIHIPDEIKNVKVPKLCIQLIVENAIKYATINRPPYCINITAVQDDDHYEISIRDNGPGFSQEILDNLMEKIEEIDNSGLLPSLRINGMGLLNVYIRYKLLHKDRTIFRLENCEPHGACVKIGEYYG